MKMVSPLDKTTQARNCTAVQDEVDRVDAKALQELHIQRELMDTVPYNSPMSKLVSAFKAVEHGKVVAWSPGVWQVQGSKGDPYTVTKDGCSCPNGQHTHKTRWSCYHTVAAELFDRWQKALGGALAGQGGEGVGNGEWAVGSDPNPTPYSLLPTPLPLPLPTPPLPLGPSTPDEHLSQAAHVAPESTIPTPDDIQDVLTPKPLIEAPDAPGSSPGQASQEPTMR